MTLERARKVTALQLLGVVVLMGSLSFAAVPFYDWFCRVTGYGGTTTTAAAPSERILDRTIKVRFDASVDRDMPWSFRPMQREVELRLGETALVFYEAHNPTDKPVAGTASFNVAPYSAGSYFAKIACFCFEMQVLQPGERVEMPVTFYVDPEIVADAEAKFLHTITLSYTFHLSDLPVEEAALRGQPAAGGAATN
ncbi:MAG: cytochrome c oxidase assembly protein [Gemmobacter sp.]|jgi:cytochrome c oxidase assembly protein subunit 11